MAYANLFLILSVLVVSVPLVYPSFFYNRLFPMHANWNKLKANYLFDGDSQDNSEIKSVADKKDDTSRYFYQQEGKEEESDQDAMKRDTKDQEEKKNRPDLRFGKRMNLK